jgi:proliferating cell nuclear antigen
MKFTTVQSMAFKTSFEVLKDIINDANMYFTKDGIRILTLDTARSALVDLNLSCENFESYSCPTDVVAGVNITNTFKLLKTISVNDTLVMEIEDREHLKIHIENVQKKTSTSFNLKLLDINEDFIEIPKTNMTVVTTMSSVDLQKICRDMNNIGTEVTISRNKAIFGITCEGDFADQKTYIECADDQNFSEHIEGTYSLKYINMFTKATNMCSIVQIMQEEQNRFLILKYNIANLGELHFYVANKVDE